jgi:hypothetical protein
MFASAPNLIDELQLRIGGAKAEGTLRRDESSVANDPTDPATPRTRHEADARREESLEGLRAHVRELLPWRSAITTEPTQMDVIDAGILDHDHVLFPLGTPYVVVGVDNWDAADAVRAALEPIARLDEDSWILDWARCEIYFREIRIFPDINCL